ncbi:Swt1 family HEPN domain-containing protein [Streptomyces sp. NPDC057617]|uniref:Swt1 family HEPN domain-containing protein n=1 Tax=Streptomyces sp. NPDC057617 TaxID=3346184 RepID=UPI0036A90D99
MAVNNRDRVTRMIDILAEGLLPFLEREMAKRQGDSWFEDAESEARGQGRQIGKNDPQFLLNLLQRYWSNYFRHLLPGSARGFASELNDVRNRWAHHESFTADDTLRALDTAERLLRAVHADAVLVDQVRESRQALHRQVTEEETKKAARKARALPSVAAEGLRPWREVLTPHPDVARGDFNASEFAADLWRVARGEGAAEYTEPEEFFQRTYLTEGLRELLAKSLRRISGDPNAAPVINLQTNFGGGKTHSMMALYHLYAPALKANRLPQDLQELIAAAPGGGLPGGPVHRAVLVGNELGIGQADVKADGTTVNTMWGQLAWGLGGRQAYDIIAEADRTSTSPGTALLQDLIAAYAPCVILIDEWVQYAGPLLGNNHLPAGSFESHFSFAQSLTEAVASVEGAQLLVSIPASVTGEISAADQYDIGGENNRTALERLQNVVHRKADTWRPASSDESFEIVRRRLFQTPTSEVQAEINKVARLYTQFYGTEKREFPAGCDTMDYERRIKSTYPIHPELFARFYEDWSTLPKFQRTRGVLRLMSTVIHALWRDQNQSPMIMPGDVPIHDTRVNQELTYYLEDSWKPIIDADVDGPGSTPETVDAEKPVLGQRGMSRRVARTVFMGSAPRVHAARKGLSEAHIRLGMAIPGEPLGNFRTALNALGDRSTYLYGDGERHWYDIHANITRTAKDAAEKLLDDPDKVWADVVRRLSPVRSVRGQFFTAVHAAPLPASDIPDNDGARLVLVHPRFTHRNAKSVPDTEALHFVQEALDQHRSATRQHRNTLVFLAPDRKEIDEVAEAVREYLGWKQVLQQHLQLDLTDNQRTQARTRMEKADETVSLRLGKAYRWVLVPEQIPGAKLEWVDFKVDLPTIDDAALQVGERLKRQGMLYLQQAPAVLYQRIKDALGQEWNRDGHISVGRLWELHTKYPYMNRLRDRSVLDQGVEDVLTHVTWETDGFALATGHDPGTGRYEGLVLPCRGGSFGQITDSTLLVRADLAVAQEAADLAAAAARDQEPADQEDADDGTGQGSGGPSLSPRPTPGGPAPTPTPLPRVPTRFYAHARLDTEQYSKHATKYAFEILQHLEAIGADVEITVEIQATAPGGFSADKVRTLIENANTLKLQAQFEEG